MALEQRADFEEVVRQFQVSGYSRLPVYSENFDQIVGVLHSKDVMPFLLKKGVFDLKRSCAADLYSRHGQARRRPADLQKSSVHLAIVVDEHGGMKAF